VFNHEPAEYDCPFCALVHGFSNDVNALSDIVARSPVALALIAPRWWPKNHGHVLVVPLVHHEGLYDLPAEVGHGVHDLTREMAVALRTSYGCQGVSIRQNNEPVGHQSVWHYHVHVFPRYTGDGLYSSTPEASYASVDKREEFAERLRSHFDG
jgi:histidine triad (HIT) family protein